MYKLHTEAIEGSADSVFGWPVGVKVLGHDNGVGSPELVARDFLLGNFEAG